MVSDELLLEMLIIKNECFKGKKMQCQFRKNKTENNIFCIGAILAARLLNLPYNEILQHMNMEEEMF